MATQASIDAVQKAYIAYYGRPADTTGLNYWADRLDADGGSFDALIDAFGTSAEATALFGGQSATATVAALYQQILGRTADLDGLNYYAGKLTSGEFSAASIAQRIYDGATGTDATLLENKLVVAKAFTAGLDTVSEVLAYSGDAAAASVRTMLATVTATTDAATFDTATTIAALETATVANGETFTLTTGTDAITGTKLNDTINAAKATLTALDKIDGGAGTDTLSITDNDSITEFTSNVTLTSVENVSFSSNGDVGTVAGSATTQTGAAEKKTVTLSDDAGTTAVTAVTVTVNGTDYTTGSLSIGTQSALYDAIAALLVKAYGDSVTIGSLSSDAFTVTAKSVGADLPDFSIALTKTAGSATIANTTAAKETIVNTGSDIAPVQTITVANGTDSLASGDKIYVNVDGVQVQAYTGGTSLSDAATAMASTINSLVGSDVATATGAIVTILGTAGEPLPLIGASLTDAALTNGNSAPTVTSAVVRQSSDTVAAATEAAALDVSGLTTETITVAKADSANVKVAAGDDVVISGVTGAIKVDGGKDVSITDATGAITSDNAAGTITITQTANTDDAVATTDGTDVTVTVSGEELVGNITVGTSGNEQSGAAVVTQNLTGSDADILNAAKTITVNGGTSATVTTTNVVTADEASDEGSVVTGSAIAVNNTSGDMTAITVTQSNTATDSEKVLTSAATKETAVFTFGALKSGEAVAIGESSATIDTDLTFTAAKDLTAEEVAQAFADLAKAATVGSASTANGYYTGTLDAGWTSGSVSGATVTFTATTAGNATDLAFDTDLNGAVGSSDSATADADFDVTVTDGKAEVVKEAAANVATVAGAITLKDNATASVTSITLDGYGNTVATTAGAHFDALETLTLKNSSNGTVALSSADVLDITVTSQGTGAGTGYEVTTLDFTGMVVTTAGNLTLVINGATVSTALALGDTESEIAAKVKAAIHADSASSATVSGNVVTVTAAANTNHTDAALGSNASASTVVVTAEGDDSAAFDIDTASTELVLNVDNVNGAVDLDTGTATITNLTINATGTATVTTLTAAALTDLTINAAVDLDTSAAALGGDTLTDVVITGAGAVDLGDAQEATLDSFDASANTGGVTASIDTDTDSVVTGDIEEYIFSAGDDVVTAAQAKVQVDVTLGAGDDTFVLAASSTTAVAADVTGGEGTDTLSMNMTSAAGLDANTLGTAKVTGFERLLISNALNNVAVDVANLGFADYVTLTGTATNASSLTNLANGATVVNTAANAVALTLAVKDAGTAGHDSDSLNLVTEVTDANIDFGSIVVANVETINISATDEVTAAEAKAVTATAPYAADKATIALTADTAATVNVTGSADVDLNTTGAKITLVDASSLTGDLVYTADGKTTGQTVLGGSGDDTLTASGENDVLKGGAGDDTIVLGDLTQAYGGAGADTFQLGIPTNAGKISTIHDLGTGDILELEADGVAGTNVAVFYNAGAQYNANTVTTFEAKANIAAAQAGEHEATWFQHEGNTYVYIEDGDASTYTAGDDTIVEIIGLVDLSTATFSSSTGLLTIA